MLLLCTGQLLWRRRLRFFILVVCSVYPDPDDGPSSHRNGNNTKKISFHIAKVDKNCSLCCFCKIAIFNFPLEAGEHEKQLLILWLHLHDIIIVTFDVRMKIWFVCAAFSDEQFDESPQVRGEDSDPHTQDRAGGGRVQQGHERCAIHHAAGGLLDSFPRTAVAGWLTEKHNIRSVLMYAREKQTAGGPELAEVQWYALIFYFRERCTQPKVFEFLGSHLLKYCRKFFGSRAEFARHWW